MTEMWDRLIIGDTAGVRTRHWGVDRVVTVLESWLRTNSYWEKSVLGRWLQERCSNMFVGNVFAVR